MLNSAILAELARAKNIVSCIASTVRVMETKVSSAARKRTLVRSHSSSELLTEKASPPSKRIPPPGSDQPNRSQSRPTTSSADSLVGTSMDEDIVSAYTLPSSQVLFSTPTISERSVDLQCAVQPTRASAGPAVQPKIIIPDINVKLTASKGYPRLVPLLKRCDSPPVCTRRADSCVAIRISSVIDYRIQSNLLGTEKFDHVTYRSLGVSPIKAVIRNLPEYVAETDVESELISLGYPVIGVS